MALESNTNTPSSSIAGTLPFGLTLRNSGLNWSPLRVSTGTELAGQAGFFQEQRDLVRVRRAVEVEFEHRASPNVGANVGGEKSGRSVIAARRAFSCAEPCQGEAQAARLPCRHLRASQSRGRNKG